MVASGWPAERRGSHGSSQASLRNRTSLQAGKSWVRADGAAPVARTASSRRRDRRGRRRAASALRAPSRPRPSSRSVIGHGEARGAARRRITPDEDTAAADDDVGLARGAGRGCGCGPASGSRARVRNTSSAAGRVRWNPCRAGSLTSSAGSLGRPISTAAIVATVPPTPITPSTRSTSGRLADGVVDLFLHDGDGVRQLLGPRRIRRQLRLGEGRTAQVERDRGLGLLRADDELGRTTADVDDQVAAGLPGQAGADAGERQPGLLLPRSGSRARPRGCPTTSG